MLVRQKLAPSKHITDKALTENAFITYKIRAFIINGIHFVQLHITEFLTSDFFNLITSYLLA